jgi:cobalt-zinc-cadmium resistance protein CzcA
MIRRILALSIRNRWLIVLASLGIIALGAWSLTRLPIDAVPDITNKQVQVNTTAFALSPAEMEKQVTFRIETALAGIPGLDHTRSISRNGFSQVTAIFTEKTDIYFARQQVNERLLELRPQLPPGVAPKMGPVSTGLGEIYMWTVTFAPDALKSGAYETPEGARLTTEVEQAAYLRTVQDWIVRPQIKGVPGVAGVDSIGGYVKQYVVQPDPMKLVALGLSFDDVVKAIEANNASRGASVIERNGEGIAVRTGGRLETIANIGAVVISTRRGIPVHVRDVAEVVIGGDIRTGSASENGREVVVGTALMRPCSMPAAVISMASGITSAVMNAARKLPSIANSTAITNSAPSARLVPTVLTVASTS